MPEGGVIVLGLDEGRDFEPVGVSDPASLEQAIAAQARTLVVPPVSVSFEKAKVDDVQVVVATVAGLPVSARPCRCRGRAYLRQADGDYGMSSQEEQQMLALGDRPRFDAVAVDGTTVDDLDEALVEGFIRNIRAVSRRMSGVDNLTVLRRRRVVEADGPRLTVAGLYALGQYPQQFTPSLAVTAAVVSEPGSADQLIDLAHLDGPIPDLLDGTMEWLRRNLRVGVRVGADGHNFDHPELPWPALRELVANALVHRDLGPSTRSKRVEIRLRAGRLVISNPGGLWGISRQQLGLPGAKSAVNDHLYDLCSFTSTPHGARIIEGEGGGIGEVQRAMAAWGAEPPLFVDKGVSFTAILTRPDPSGAVPTPVRNEPSTQMAATAKIEAALAEGPLNRRALAQRCHLSLTQARYALGKLLQDGRVTMNGGWGARNTTYQVTPPHH
jgi:ATP-dependent DNA helicase RecG